MSEQKTVAERLGALIEVMDEAVDDWFCDRDPDPEVAVETVEALRGLVPEVKALEDEAADARSDRQTLRPMVDRQERNAVDRCLTLLSAAYPGETFEDADALTTRVVADLKAARDIQRRDTAAQLAQLGEALRVAQLQAEAAQQQHRARVFEERAKAAQQEAAAERERAEALAEEKARGGRAWGGYSVRSKAAGDAVEGAVLIAEVAAEILGGAARGVVERGAEVALDGVGCLRGTWDRLWGCGWVR